MKMTRIKNNRYGGMATALIFCTLLGGIGVCTAKGNESKEPSAHPVLTEKVAAPVPNAPLNVDNQQKSGSQITELTPDPLTTLLVLSSLDGTLTAVDRISGELRWISKDEPMIKVPAPAGPANPKAPYFLPDPKSGSLYVMGRKNSLRKMQFTIPQLVAMAPCKNSEGMMYTGRKLDYWLKLNPHTGEKSEVPLYGESTCPAKPEDDITESCTTNEKVLPGNVRKSLLIGKTEYTLSMADGPRKWNVTYHHYSSVDMNAQLAQDYDLVHFTSPSTGAVLTYDRETGQLLWQRELESPIIAVYNVDCTTSNLISVPFNPIAPETLARLKSVSSKHTKPLSSTTYIGESNHGLYAVPSLVDDMVLIMDSAGTTQFPPLIEGPSLQDNNDTPTTTPSTDLNKESSETNAESIEPDFILLGYYTDPPDPSKTPVKQIGSSSEPSSNVLDSDSLPPGHYNESNPSEESIDNESSMRIDGFSSPNGEGADKHKLDILATVPLSSPHQVSPNKIQFPPFPMPQKQPISPAPEARKELKPYKIVLTTVVLSVGGTIIVIGAIFFVYRKHSSRNTGTKKQEKEKTSDTEEESPSTTPLLKVRQPRKSADGNEVSVGKISFTPNSVLGHGCEGTFVFKGKFEDRDVAVKRILPECFAFADREVDLLKQSDQHANVIRYFCTESDGQFRYIALELCEATLSDWIEGKYINEFLDPIQVLKEATDGLAHLHSLRIVHRDIKPANVLISVSNGSNGDKVRTMISDFGLCKKITNGRMSFSRRSGGIPGTDGWIAPEVLNNLHEQSHRMSYSVDVFSLGCVYYYVLTKGEHPFGEALHRQSNIINDAQKIEQLSEHPQGVSDLISLMISSNASSRPPLDAVLCHPIFWSKEKMLAFILDVSDRIEKEDERCLLLRRLESDGTRIVREDWRDHICPEVAMDLRKYRTYKGQSVRDLLRALRNKKNHYRELTPEAQASLGNIPNEFVTYWISRFPLMLPYTWLKFESVRTEVIFSRYYPESYSFNYCLNGEDEIDEDLGDILESSDSNRLSARSSSSSPDKSPRVDKNFWRSKSQFKYNKWKKQQQNSNVRENPHNFTSFATREYPPQHNAGFDNFSSPDTDPSWRKPVAKDK